MAQFSGGNSLSSRSGWRRRTAGKAAWPRLGQQVAGVGGQPRGAFTLKPGSHLASGVQRHYGPG
jgi:hypothetical protein